MYTFVHLIFDKNLIQNHLKSCSTIIFPRQKVSTLFVQQSFLRPQGWPMGSLRVLVWTASSKVFHKGLKPLKQKNGCLFLCEIFVSFGESEKNLPDVKGWWIFLFQCVSLDILDYVCWVLNSFMLALCLASFRWAVGHQRRTGIHICPWYKKETWYMDDEVVGSWKCFSWKLEMYSYWLFQPLNRVECWNMLVTTWLISCRYPTCALA